MKVLKFVGSVVKDSINSTVDGLRYVNKSKLSVSKVPKQQSMRMSVKPSPIVKNIKIPKMGSSMRQKLNRESVEVGKEPRF